MEKYQNSEEIINKLKLEIQQNKEKFNCELQVKLNKILKIIFIF
jgi:hypothetical protein